MSDKDPVQRIWYDEDGYLVAKPEPKTLPGSRVVTYQDDDYDTPEARQQDPQEQARLLAEYRRDQDSGVVRYDLSDAERYWFGDDLGGNPWR